MAVQVSGMHLAGAEVDPEPLRGIKTFVRDILPRRPHASPEGGTTPVLSDPGLEDTWTDNSHLKRKSCLKEDESVDSDASDSEHLPSSKRQRITVSAMRRLFAKFSLSDTDEVLQSTTRGAPKRAALAPSSREATPRHSPEREDAPQSDTEDTLDEKNEKQGNSPHQFSARAQSEKRISETDTSEEHSDKRQKTSDQETSEDENQDTRQIKERKEENENNEEETSVKEVEKTVVKSEDTSKTNKRQADTRESDTEEREETGNKVKRTRRLRRGLRLCTNITCYIEQVLYN